MRGEVFLEMGWEGCWVGVGDVGDKDKVWWRG